MSTAAVIPGPGAPGGGLAALLADLNERLDLLVGEVARPTSVSLGDVTHLERTIRRLEGIKLALIAKADRQDTHKRTGDSGTSSWLNGATRSGGGAAARQVDLAKALDETLPRTKEALGLGEVSTEAASVINSTMRKLPESLTDVERDSIETTLVRDAKTLDPARLRKQARLALAAAEKSAEEVAAHQEAELVDEETRAYQQAHLTLHNRGDGTTQGRFTVPTGVAETLRKVLHSMTAPRRDHYKSEGNTTAEGNTIAEDRGRGDGAGGRSSVDGAGRGAAFGLDGRGDESSDGLAGANTSRNSDWDRLDWAQKRGRAFVDLLEHLDTERLHGKVAATVVVTLSLEQALGAARAAELSELTGVAAGPSVGAANTDTGHQHSTATARRLACNAGILPVVLGGASLPLDVGRQDRFFTEAQRVALAAIYDECAAANCDRPYSWSELHHEDPWATGGRTDLDRAVPLCGYHHRLIHDSRVPHRITSGDAGRKTVLFGARC
ncbi:MAG TPA: DUF222 domain-containing protein [Intrasporangiaceae bacterium]|nr:DUF222 domain-containing protein [Intrasporangiaceae bacterium]